MIHANEVLRMKQRLNDIYSRHTGQAVNKVEKDMERDYFMSPEEALEYGIIDKVIERKRP
jgi:ATP-dependent Clp protease protease subunit